LLWDMGGRPGGYRQEPNQTATINLTRGTHI
jgi:hypothetical protein